MSVPLSQKDRIKEILKCGKNPVYFIKTYVKIQHPRKGLIPFETYEFQDDCVQDFQDHRFNIVLKSRQLGLSTITAAYAVWLAIFHKDKNVLVIATKLNTAINFIKKVKVMIESLPKWLLLTKYEPTKQHVRFSNGSNITAIPTSPDAGRSEALSLLIVDEAAFIRDFEDIWTGLYPTLTTGGSAIILSTPNGATGQYYKLWTDATSGQNDFNTIYLPWHVHPEHDQEWFDKETKNLSKRKISQEYLCDFISSGENFLQTSEMDYLRSMIVPPLRKEGIANSVWIWKNPDPSHKYAISADIARGDAQDFTTFQIVDATSQEVVAEYMGKIPPDKLGEILIEYGKKYNNALLCPEKNTFGYFTCIKLRDENYKKLWYKSTTGDPWMYTPKDPDEIPGFDTQVNSRAQILAKLEELIRNKEIKLYSQRLYDEFQSFYWHGPKAQAAKDSHDDLIMALAIGLWITMGDSKRDDNYQDWAAALLQATRVVKSNVEVVPMQHLNKIKSSYEAQIAKNDYMKPVQITPDSRHSRNISSDFNWLLK